MAIIFANAVTIAQMAFLIEVRFSPLFILCTREASENERGWLFGYANWDYHSVGLTVGGCIPFFVDRESGRVGRYASFHHGDFERWYQTVFLPSVTHDGS